MKKERTRYLRFIVNFWSVIAFVILILNVWIPNRFTEIIGPTLAIYTGALALYSAEKEFERWKFYFTGRHPGEVYVVIWTVLILGIFIWKYSVGSPYKMEPEIIATYIVVLGILAITKKSKTFFTEMKGLKRADLSRDR